MEYISNPKKVIVLFSGGLDSTYLLYKNAKEGNIVQPVYIELKNNENKTIVEKQQAKLIINELHNEFGYNVRSLDIISSIEIYNASNVNFPQPLLWAISIPFVTGIEYKEVQIGYVLGDDAIAYLEDIKHLYESTKSFSYKFTPIKFPLIKKHKHDLLSELPQKYHNLITSCENPILKHYGIKLYNNSYRFYEPCCDCISCKKIITHNYFSSEIIKKKYSKPLYHQTQQELLRLKNYINVEKDKEEYFNSKKYESTN